MVSQLLFGEGYDVTESKEDWIKVKCWYDGYEGWMDKAQSRTLAPRDVSSLKSTPSGIALEVVNSATSPERAITVVNGSSLPGYDGMNFKIGNEKFIYNGQALLPGQIVPGGPISMLEKIALRYLHAPYLWGGRSPFGIDCSGLTQVVFKCLGVALPRDAYQQAEMGTTLNFVEETQPGDLAFFHNPEGKITHVGIILKDQQIIHASGRVRIDRFDHFGIYRQETKKYSHQLKLLKRVL